MPYVIADSNRNPAATDWLKACAGMTMHFHIIPYAPCGAQLKMKNLFACFLIMVFVPFLLLTSPALGQGTDLEAYVSGFDYAARKEMKINSPALIKGIVEEKLQLVDIRFREETAAWRMGFGLQIPLNELPARLKEIQKDKIIVTACPHKDRAILAMAYLREKGFSAKYLEDGLVGLAEYLRGDMARDFISKLAK